MGAQITTPEKNPNAFALSHKNKVGTFGME